MMEKLITLIGPSGTWKSTKWKLLSKEIWYHFIDFDDDVLEKINIETAIEVLEILNLQHIEPIEIVNETVWNILKILWSDNFLMLEWILLKDLKLENNTILATSWSLPLSDWSMDYLNSIWKTIYLESDSSQIADRLENMKLDRIVWIPENIFELEKDEQLKIYNEIMSKRTEKYEKYSDIEYKKNTKTKYKPVLNKNWIKFIWQYTKEIDQQKDRKFHFNDFYKFLKEKWIVKL